MDEIDFKLIKELHANSRTPYRELADKMGLSVNSVHKRVQSMVDRGIIQKFTIDLTNTALPMIQVGIKGVSVTTDIDDTVERLRKNPNTWRISVASGNSLITTGVISHAAEMNRYVSFVVREGKMKNPDVTVFNIPEAQNVPETTLSYTDYRIVAALLDDSRKQVVDVATELGLSASTVRRRLERMEKNKLIYYSINWDPCVDSATSMFTIRLRAGVDQPTVAATLKKNYAKNLLSYKILDTHPDHILMGVWTRSMIEIKELQDAMMKEGLFEQIVPEIIYKAYFFDTWRAEYVRKKATMKE